MIIEWIIKQIRFYLDFKSFTYHNLFRKINQNNGKKERAGEGLVGGQKVQEVGGTNSVSQIGWEFGKKSGHFFIQGQPFPLCKVDGKLCLECMVALYLRKYYKQKLILEHYTVAIVSKNIKPLKSLVRSLAEHLELGSSLIYQTISSQQAPFWQERREHFLHFHSFNLCSPVFRFFKVEQELKKNRDFFFLSSTYKQQWGVRKPNPLKTLRKWRAAQVFSRDSRGALTSSGPLPMSGSHFLLTAVISTLWLQKTP